MLAARPEALTTPQSFAPVNLANAQYLSVENRFVIDIEQIKRLVPIAPPVDDHANSYGAATVMSSGVVTGFVSANGTIGTSSDEDWFAVELQAGQAYGFVLWPNSTTNSHLDPRLTLWDPSGTQVLVSNDNLSATTLMSFIRYDINQSGTYYLRAEGMNGTTGDFILTATPITVDPTAGGLTGGGANTDPNPGNSYWQWQGTSGDNYPSDSALEAGGNPQTTSNNYYRGHDGDDRIYADSGDDVVWGDSGEDSLYGEDGNDVLRGGRHDDSLYAGDGNDLLYGEDGDDYMSAGDGNDTLYGGDEDDTLRGSDGDDYLKGEDDNDDLSGGYGDDQLYGDGGDDIVDGGYGRRHPAAARRMRAALGSLADLMVGRSPGGSVWQVDQAGVERSHAQLQQLGRARWADQVFGQRPVNQRLEAPGLLGQQGLRLGLFPAAGGELDVHALVAGVGDQVQVLQPAQRHGH